MVIDVPDTVQAAFIGAIVAAVGGGAVAEWRQGLQLRREARRMLNRVLFHQLELVYRLKQSKLEPVLDEVERALRTRFPSEDVSALRTIFSSPVILAALREMLDIPAQIADQYQDAIEAVAEVDPILAYRLSGHDAITKHRVFVERYLEALRSSAIAAGHQVPSQVANFMKDFLEKTVQADAIDGLEQDAMMVATALGWRVRRKARERLSKPVLRDPNELSEKIQELVDGLSKAGIGIRAV